MKTNSAIFCALLALIAVMGIMKADNQREFEALRAERQAALDLVTARVSKLPELREEMDKAERRVNAFVAWTSTGPRPEFTAARRDYPSDPVMQAIMTPFDDGSFSDEQTVELRELETKIRRAESQLTLIYELENYLHFLEAQLEIFENSAESPTD